MMILNGINIFPAAIEDTLESHTDVQEAVAYPMRSAIHGDIPVAASSSRPGAKGPGDAAGSLPPEARHPRAEKNRYRRPDSKKQRRQAPAKQLAGGRGMQSATGE